MSQWMKDFDFAGRGLRIFYRGWKCPLLPYGFHRWGFYGFGALCIGFMFWPKPDPAASLGGRT